MKDNVGAAILPHQDVVVDGGQVEFVVVCQFVRDEKVVDLHRRVIHEAQVRAPADPIGRWDAEVVRWLVVVWMVALKPAVELQKFSVMLEPDVPVHDVANHGMALKALCNLSVVVCPQLAQVDALQWKVALQTKTHDRIGLGRLHALVVALGNDHVALTL